MKLARLCALMVSTALIGCAGDPTTDGSGDVAAETAALGAAPIPAEVLQALTAPGEPSEEELDQVYYLDHDLHVGPGRTVHVHEAFTLRSWMRWPHRAVLMLPGPLSNASFFNLDVDGYRFQDTLAKNGYFAFSVDYEGAGSSSYPDDGYDVTHDYLVDEQRRVMHIIRLLRFVPRVDVLGESNGAAIGAELCADRAARSCVLSSALYVHGTDFFTSVFLDPGFVWFLSNQPNGYIDAGPEMYFNITLTMTPEVGAATLATQPGRYAAAPLIVPVNGLPWFDPTHARVPALILSGTADDIAAPDDPDLFAAAYGSAADGGGTATVVRIEGGSHIPRVDPPPVNEQWTDEVVSFLESH